MLSCRIVLTLHKGATLVIYKAHGPYTLVGPPIRGLVLDPLAALTSTTVYIFWVNQGNIWLGWKFLISFWEIYFLFSSCTQNQKKLKNSATATPSKSRFPSKFWKWSGQILPGKLSSTSSANKDFKINSSKSKNKNPIFAKMGCCVFQPANVCFAHHLPVKIIFSTFSGLYIF